MNQLYDPKNAYRPAVKPVRRKTSNQNIAGSFFKSFFGSFLILVIIAVVLYRSEVITFVGDVYTFAERVADPEKRVEFSLPFSPKRQNILVIGVDAASNEEDPFKGNRSDAMLLVSIAPHGKNVNVISIPRDSKVYIADRTKPDKINHAFAYGGIGLTVKTVEETFGVRINHYIAISNQGLVKFIDTIGGLPIYIEKDMYYNDSAGNLHINLPKGDRILSGKEAEGYMRFRKDALGDIGRIRRQQWFFNALGARLKEPQVLVKIPEVLKVMPKYILTDLSVYELSQYAALAKSIDMSTVQVATLPGSPSQRGSISYWILDPEKTQDIINRLVYRDKPKPLEGPVSIGILYVPSMKEEAENLKQTFEEQGFKVNLKVASKLGHDHIAIHNLDLPNDLISGLKKRVPDIKEKQTVYDPIGLNKAARDFTIVLAGS